MNNKNVDTNAYRELFTAGNLMGPNSVLLLGELLGTWFKDEASEFKWCQICQNYGGSPVPYNRT